MPPLVAIGDSFTQGFKNLAIAEANLSFPALIARALGHEERFLVPDFAYEGGLPLNMETFLRKSGRRVNFVSLLSLFTGLGSLGKWNADNRRYWEKPKALVESLNTQPPIFHNLAMWGYCVLDSYRYMSAGHSKQVIKDKIPQPKDLSQRFKPSYSYYRCAIKGLNPTQNPALDLKSQLQLAQSIGEAEVIERLIFCLGANNILGAILNVGQKPILSEEADLNRSPKDRKLTVWRPEHFEIQYMEAFEQVQQMNCNSIYVGNIPRFSILPCLRGQTVSGPNEPDSTGYFEYYYAPYIRDNDFKKKPSRYASFTREEMQFLDGTVDAYNAIIEKVVSEFNRPEKPCHLVDLNGLLDSLAYRRNFKVQHYQFPDNLYEAWQRISSLKDRTKPHPQFPSKQIPILDTRFYTFNSTSSDPEKRYEGGLISLDGMHPTTTFAGMVAYLFLQKMGLENLATADWWERILRDDTLLMEPPIALENLMNTLGDLQALHIFRLAKDLFI